MLEIFKKDKELEIMKGMSLWKISRKLPAKNLSHPCNAHIPYCHMMESISIPFEAGLAPGFALIKIWEQNKVFIF